MVPIIIIALIILILISYVISTSNELTKLRNKVRELDADIDVALTKRYDVLKKQYDTVKMYCSYESQTLIRTIQLRNGMSVSEKQAVEENMNRLAKQLQITCEAYPELQSGRNAVMLQQSIDDTEGHLQAARRLYNLGVTDYNNKCMMFPSSVIAGIGGFRQAEYFKADSAKREDPMIE